MGAPARTTTQPHDTVNRLVNDDKVFIDDTDGNRYALTNDGMDSYE